MPEGRRPDISARLQIDDLLVRFYSRALVDPLLGPVFSLAQLDLVTHLPRIGDFWERSLLGSGSYGGQPMLVHRQLHAAVPLSVEMFDQWVALWQHAVDELATGPVAEAAKDTARRVATAMARQLLNPSPPHPITIRSS